MADISRRDFLKVATAVSVGTLIGGVGRAIISNLDPDKDVKESGLSTEQKKLIDEITGFRKSLGLEGPPLELAAILSENTMWSNEAPKFQNNLPEKNISYGDYTEDVLHNLFGTNSTRLVKGCRYEPTQPGGMMFDPDERFCLFPDNVHSFPIESEYINFILHEAIGHGSDPAVETSLYPNGILINVEHGKWRALTQMFNLPGEMLNNPGDQMYPMLKRQVGKSVGKTFVVNNNLDQVLEGDKKVEIEQQISDIAKEKGVSPKELKFNKAVCREISSKIITSILNGTITIKGDLKDTYSLFMEKSVSAEIYAEMTRYVILYPEKMNETVIQGISEVLSAINGQPINLKEMKNKIEHPSQEVITRNMAETEAVAIIQNTSTLLTTVQNNEQEAKTTRSQTEGNKPTESVLSNQQMVTIAEQQLRVEAQKSDFDSFTEDGKIPNSLRLLDSQIKTVDRFAKIYSGFNKKWPGIVNIDISRDDSYDPNMNLWEIEDLDYAISPSFIRGLLQNTEVSGQVMGEIEKKTKIIESLYNAPILPG